MSISTPYNDFQAPNNVVAEGGGPWSTPASSSDLFCWTGPKNGFCSTYGCIPCTHVIGSMILTFNVKYIANVTLPLSHYGNPDYVDYTFDYNLNWASDKTAAGAPLTARVSIGDSSSIENFGASDHAWLWWSRASTLGDPFHHAGTTSLLKSADGVTGYIPIIIDFSFTRQIGSHCQWYFIGGNFRITPKATAGNSPSSGLGVIAAGTSSSVASSLPSSIGPMTQSASHSLSSIILPGFSTQSVSSSLSSQVSTGGGLDPLFSPPGVSVMSVQTVPTAAVIGAILGLLSLLGFLALFLFLLYRKSKKQPMEHDKNDLADTDAEGGNDDSRRAETTVPSGSFIGFGISLSEPKSSYQPDGFTNVAAPPSTIPSPPNPNNHLYENLQAILQQRENHRRRSTRHDHRPQPSLSSYVTAYNMDAPPPAYSDVSNIFERTGGRQYQENEENLSEEDDVGEAPERIR